MNAITRLTRADSIVCIGQEKIKQEIVGFHKKLIGTATEELSMVDKRVVARGPTLSAAQISMLNSECSEEEVRLALFSMESNKAPGIDGYNVFFFKKCWHIIGAEITLAVQ